jgi:hypothetical protein
MDVYNYGSRVFVAVRVVSRQEMSRPQSLIEIEADNEGVVSMVFPESQKKMRIVKPFTSDSILSLFWWNGRCPEICVI